MLPDFERADRIGEFWSYPESRAFAELLIDCEEDRTLRAVLIGPVRRQTFYHRVWGPSLEAAGLQGFRFGQLRHTGATMALEAGANPVLVAFRLGHVSTRMVEQHYAGRLDRADKEIAEALAARARCGTVAARGGFAGRVDRAS